MYRYNISLCQKIPLKTCSNIKTSIAKMNIQKRKTNIKKQKQKMHEKKKSQNHSEIKKKKLYWRKFYLM